MNKVKKNLLKGAVTSAAILAIFSSPASYAAPALHGYCGGVGQCVDNGTNSPTNINPPSNFGFTVGSGPKTGNFVVDILVPNNELSPSSFALTGTLSGSATLFNSTAWTSGKLDAYLGISASPANPIGAYLPSTQALDHLATGFFVYQADLGTATLKSPSKPNILPLENIGVPLPKASYIVGFLNTGTRAPNWLATANSGAIFSTSPVPEPESYAMLLAGLGLMGFMVNRKKSA
jgi:hypothetical protein